MADVDIKTEVHTVEINNRKIKLTVEDCWRCSGAGYFCDDENSYEDCHDCQGHGKKVYAEFVEEN